MGAAAHRSFLEVMAIGALPGWVALGFVCLIYGYLIGIVVFVRSDVHGDELTGEGVKREKVRRIDL
jgi:uncharacterized membrane protein